jgi:hypothetical protein
MGIQAGPRLRIAFLGVVAVVLLAVRPTAGADAAGPFDAGIYRLGMPQPVGHPCGGERLAVRAVSDAGAALDPAVQDTTVTALRGIAAPAVGPDAPRQAGVETTLYRVPVQLVSVTFTADSETALVVADPTNVGATMVVRLPDPMCSNVLASNIGSDLARALGAVERACGVAQAGVTAPLYGRATITGVGYVSPDRLAGSAPNGIELHPVLRFEEAWCSRTAPTATPAPPTNTPVPATATPTATSAPAAATATPTAQATATAIPTDTPAPTATAIALLLDRGFGQSGAEVGYAFRLRNPDPARALTDSNYQVAAYDAGGHALKTDAGYVHRILPGEVMGIGGTLFVPDKTTVARVDVQILPGTLAPVGQAKAFTTSGVTYRADPYRPTVTGLVANPTSKAVQNLFVSAVPYDAAGRIIGGGWTFLDFVPANDKSAVEVSVISSSEPARVELYATTSSLSDTQ